MKDILKMIKFDYQTTKPTVMPVFLIIAGLCIIFGLFFSPLVNAYIVFVATIFFPVLAQVEEKSNFHKLYGILPVDWKSIYRAKFLYIFLVCFFTELLELSSILISMSLKLYRFLPNRGSMEHQLMKTSFEFGSFLNFGTCVCICVGICIMFSYMEMMGQIFGRENEMKIILISLGVITVLSVTFFKLDEADLIPHISKLSFLQTLSSKIISCVLLNFLTFGLCILFGEITTSKLSKREL